MRKGSTLSYIYQDHLGGTSITESGTVDTIKYYPYGSTRSGDVTTDYKFTGQRRDGTGLYYYKAASVGPSNLNTGVVNSPLTVSAVWAGRYYHPSIGRFIQPDTIVPDLYKPETLNRYTYVENNPLRYVDEDGHFVPLVIIAGLAGCALVGGVVGATNYLLTHKESSALGAFTAFGTGAAAGMVTGTVTLLTGNPLMGAAAGVATGIVSNSAINAVSGESSTYTGTEAIGDAISGAMPVSVNEGFTQAAQGQLGGGLVSLYASGLQAMCDQMKTTWDTWGIQLGMDIAAMADASFSNDED